MLHKKWINKNSVDSKIVFSLKLETAVLKSLFSSLQKIPGRKGDTKSLYNNLLLQKRQKYLQRIHNLFVTDKLSLQLEALSNCDSFNMITILHNNHVSTWDYKNNNKYLVTMS